jgi:membrane-bound metal-dependent hydrolase YbcI (DUF457 family)
MEFVQPHMIKGMPTGLVLCTGAAILGALAPDLDADDASIQHDLGGVSEIIRGGLLLFGVQHRGVLHSGLVSGLVMALGWLVGRSLGYADVGLAFGLGYLSHIVLADAMTIRGVPLFWPLDRPFHLLPKGLRVRTGGPVEGLVFLLVAVGVVGVFWLRPDLIPTEIFSWLKLIWKG